MDLAGDFAWCPRPRRTPLPRQSLCPLCVNVSGRCGLLVWCPSVAIAASCHLAAAAESARAAASQPSGDVLPMGSGGGGCDDIDHQHMRAVIHTWCDGAISRSYACSPPAHQRSNRLRLHSILLHTAPRGFFSQLSTSGYPPALARSILAQPSVQLQLKSTSPHELDSPADRDEVFSSFEASSIVFGADLGLQLVRKVVTCCDSSMLAFSSSVGSERDDSGSLRHEVCATRHTAHASEQSSNAVLVSLPVSIY
jgi:hypothetical protein